MKEKSTKFRIVDILLILMMVLPLVAAMVIKILTNEPSLDGGVSIAGARIFFSIPMPIQDLIITEAQINAWLILIPILGACLFFTHGLNEDKRDWRQMAAEWVVEKVDGDMALSEMTVRNVVTGETTVIRANETDGTFGLFGFVGYEPNSALFEGKLEMKNGYIVTDEDMHTSVPDVFAAGDLRVKSLRQVITAAADGAIAAMQAAKYIEEM